MSFGAAELSFENLPCFLALPYAAFQSRYWFGVVRAWFGQGGSGMVRAIGGSGMVRAWFGHGSGTLATASYPGRHGHSRESNEAYVGLLQGHSW